MDIYNTVVIEDINTIYFMFIYLNILILYLYYDRNTHI